VIDRTIPGLIASPEYIFALSEKLSAITCSKDGTIVLDLYGNLAYRFKQFDCSLSLQYKSGGKYHLAGSIVTCPLATFKTTLDNTSCLFLAKKQSLHVVVPLLPRYLCAVCCKQVGHCPNVEKPEYVSHFLADFIRLRNCLKRFVAGLGASKCRVLDTCCVTDCSPTANSVMRVDALKKVTARDSIHFLNMGYDHLVKNIMQTFAYPESTPTGKHLTAKVYYWQGFRSPMGSSVAASNTSHPFHGHGGQMRVVKDLICPL
jgi:hypothetical protein